MRVRIFSKPKVVLVDVTCMCCFEGLKLFRGRKWKYDVGTEGSAESFRAVQKWDTEEDTQAKQPVVLQEPAAAEAHEVGEGTVRALPSLLGIEDKGGDGSDRQERGIDHNGHFRIRRSHRLLRASSTAQPAQHAAAGELVRKLLREGLVPRSPSIKCSNLSYAWHIWKINAGHARSV